MSFAAPWTVPALAAALTVPPLVLLYFLKLRRREVPISSTLLWLQAVQDLRVNAPFQKLRNNLLLILQLLILAAGVLAVWEPMRAGAGRLEQATVFIVDASASMSVEEGEGRTRLDIARQEVLRLIDRLGGSERAMVIAFADRARVLAPFTDNRAELRRAVESIRPTDAPGRLAEAIALANAHASKAGEATDADQRIARTAHLLFTDGRLADAGGVSVEHGTLEVIRIGRATENVGIVNLDVRRSYEQPVRVTVLARVRNFGAEAASRDVQLLVDGRLRDVRRVESLAPAATAEELSDPAADGPASEGSSLPVAFELDLDAAALVEVRLSGADALAADDRAFAVVTPPQALSVLVVTPGNRFLRQLMNALPLAGHAFWTPQEYEQAPEEKLADSGRCRFDVVVLDGHSTERLPAGNYIFLGGIPLIEGVEQAGRVEAEPFLDWDDTHPVLQHVSVPAIAAVSWLRLRLPAEARSLIESPSGPVLSLLRRERNQYLICALGLFDDTRTVLNTTWVFHEGFVAFMYDGIRHLAGATSAGRRPAARPGEALVFPARPGASSVTVRRPDGTSETVEVRGRGEVLYGRTDRAGLYTVSPGPAGDDTRAVNLLDEAESLIAPAAGLQIASGAVETSGTDKVTRRPLWPAVLLTLCALLVVEWLVYSRRVLV